LALELKRPRILVDISAQFQTAERVPRSIERIEREIARRLLSDKSLTTLPILFVGGLTYVIDRQDALHVLNRTEPRPHEETDVMEFSKNGAAQAPSSPRSGVWQRAQRAGLDVATRAI
jgi:hypothetical protein